jgi:hypothetical protein
VLPAGASAIVPVAAAHHKGGCTRTSNRSKRSTAFSKRAAMDSSLSWWECTRQLQLERDIMPVKAHHCPCSPLAWEGDGRRRELRNTLPTVHSRTQLHTGREEASKQASKQLLGR